MVSTKIILTAFNGFGMMFLGIQISQKGPAFIDLIEISGTSIEGGALYATGGNVCYMVGSFVSGYLHSRMKAPALIIALALIACGVLTALVPWCTTFYSMLLTFSSATIFSGMFETAISTEQMKIGEGDSASAMQFLNFAFSFGGIIGPLITEPFLSPIEKGNETVQSNVSKYSLTYIPLDDTKLLVTSLSNANISQGNITQTVEDLLFHNESTNEQSTNDPTDRSSNYTVRYAFLITAVLSLLVSIPFFFQYFKSCRQESIKRETGESEPASRKLPFKMYFFILIIGSIYYFLFAAVDDSFSSFLSYFVVNHLDWTKESGALVTSLYWGLSTLVRLGLIFLASKIDTGVLLIVSNIGMVLSFTGFTIASAFYGHVLIWVFTALLSISVSAVFGGAMAWVDTNLILMNGRVTACFIVSSAFGASVMPIPVGILMNNWSTMAFAYLLFTFIFLDLIFIIIMLYILKPVVHRKYGPPRSTITMVVGDSKMEDESSMDLATEGKSKLSTATNESASGCDPGEEIAFV